MPTARLFDRPQDYLFRQPVLPPTPPPPPVKPPPPFTLQSPDQYDAEMVGGIGNYSPQTGTRLSDIAGDMTEGGQGLVPGGQSVWGIPLPTSIKASPIDLGNGYRLVAVVKPAVLSQSGQVLTPARLDWEMVESIPPLKQPAPQEVNPGNSLVDPTTGKVLYTAPSKLEQGKVLVDDPEHPGGYLEVWSINGNPQRNAVTGVYAQIFRTIPPPASLREAPASRNYEKWNPATKTHDTIIEKWNPTTSTWEADKTLAGKPAPAEAPPRPEPKMIPNKYVVGGQPVEVYSEWDNQAKQWVYDYEGADKRAKQIADDINKQARQSTIDNAALVAQQQAIAQGQKDLGENTKKTADFFRTLNFLKSFPTAEQKYPDFLAQLPQGESQPSWLTAGGEELWNAPTGANWMVNEARRQGLIPGGQPTVQNVKVGSGTASDPWRSPPTIPQAPPDINALRTFFQPARTLSPEQVWAQKNYNTMVAQRPENRSGVAIQSIYNQAGGEGRNVTPQEETRIEELRKQGAQVEANLLWNVALKDREAALRRPALLQAKPRRPFNQV